MARCAPLAIPSHTASIGAMHPCLAEPLLHRIVKLDVYGDGVSVSEFCGCRLLEPRVACEPQDRACLRNMPSAYA